MMCMSATDWKPFIAMTISTMVIQMMKKLEKSCLNCKYCYDKKECVLLDDLIIGYCFMHEYRKGVAVE